MLALEAARIAQVEALGLDETLFCRRGRFARRAWCTSIVDVASGQLLDIVAGRTADGPARWLLSRPASWRRAVRWAVLDLSGPYRAAYAAAVNRLAEDLQDPGLPPEINRLGRTIWNWRAQIANWHAARVTNAPTEAANNLIKRVKRVAFGFTNFANYRIRALLYAGKPNWALLDTLTPPLNPKSPIYGIRTPGRAKSAHSVPTVDVEYVSCHH